jgi:hypothetical protein
MKLASVLVAAAFVGLAGYTIAMHLGGDGGPVAEVVTLPPKRVAVPEPVPAVRTAAVTSEAQYASPGQSRAQGQSPDQKAVTVPGDRASLARALQRELQRVGCYDGEVNGTWTTSTRMAMKAFTDRVNASLPIDQPDYILLSLVQRHDGRACGTNCPTGQLLSDEGRCVPSAVLAKAPTKPTASIETRDNEKSGVASSSSWSPTAGLAAGATAGLAADAARASANRGSAGLPGGRPESAASEPREDRSRYAAARPDTDADAAMRERDRNAESRRYARAEDATPEATGNTGNDEPPRKVRKRHKQPKFVRQFLRSMRGVMAGLPF